MLVDDHSLVRAGVRALLERGSEWDVVAEASNGREALERLTGTPVDLVLMDISMPVLDGIETTARLREEHPRLPVLMLSMHADQTHVRRALEAGATGYCVKEAGPDDLLVGLHTVIRGDSYVTPALARALTVDGPPDKYTAGLTGRQRQILELIALGNTSKEIAKGLGISVKTVESHRTALMRFLGIHALAGLVRYAIRIGLVTAFEEPRSALALLPAHATSAA